MKIIVEREKFIKALQKVSNIIGSRSTLPVLANVLMETQNGKLVLTTTDLEIRITTSVEAEIISEGKTTMPAKKLFTLASKFTGDKIDFSCNENNHADIVCGTSNVKLLGLATDDFPTLIEFESRKSLKFKEVDFARMLDQISYSVSLDETRKVLHGILCSIKENNVTMVATDGKRLALSEKVPESFEGEDGDTIIPLKTALEIKRLLGGDGLVTINFAEKQIEFVTETVTVISKLIEGNYPNYRQVIPGSFSKIVEIPTSEMLSKLDLVSAALADNSSYIVLTLENDMLQLEGSSTSIGEVKDYIKVEYNGDKLDVSFNPTFLSDPLKHSDSDKVKMKLNDGFSPVAIEGNDGFLYVIMPMRNR